VWRDWALLGVAVAASLIEAALRPDRTWLLTALAVSIVVALCVLWRRTHPLAAVAVAFGTLIVFDVARIVASDATGLSGIAVALVLPYALFRWASGREAAIGLGIILVWLGVTHVADPTTVGEVVAAYGFFLFSAALGASIRFHATTRMRDIEQAELRQRHELARDLHDTIGHHMSGIVIQAQAGRAVAAPHPDRALAVLETIEQAATRRWRRCAQSSVSCAWRPSRTSPRSPALLTLSGSPAHRRDATHRCAPVGRPARPPCGGQRRAIPDRAGSPHQHDAPRPQRHPRAHRPGR